jgi:hypothetical protein
VFFTGVGFLLHSTKIEAVKEQAERYSELWRKELADLYGRLQPDKFREIWEKLNKRLRESKV